MHPLFVFLGNKFSRVGLASKVTELLRSWGVEIKLTDILKKILEVVHLSIARNRKKGHVLLGATILASLLSSVIDDSY